MLAPVGAVPSPHVQPHPAVTSWHTPCSWMSQTETTLSWPLVGTCSRVIVCAWGLMCPFSSVCLLTISVCVGVYAGVCALCCRTTWQGRQVRWEWSQFSVGCFGHILMSEPMKLLFDFRPMWPHSLGGGSNGAKNCASTSSNEAGDVTTLRLLECDSTNTLRKSGAFTNIWAMGCNAPVKEGVFDLGCVCWHGDQQLTAGRVEGRIDGWMEVSEWVMYL